MKKILIKSCLLNNKVTDILIEGNVIKKIAPEIEVECKTNLEIIDAKDMAALPPFYNCHNHAAMTLLRGYANDLELFTWLKDYIWPIEAKMSFDDVYIGAKLACIEMIKSGTVFFADMYWNGCATIKALEQFKMRASIGLLYLEQNPGENLPHLEKSNAQILEIKNDLPNRIQLALTPHAIYTVSEKNLRKIKDISDNENLPVHMHVAETAFEVEQCKLQHNGKSVIEYLDDIGIVNEKLYAAHCVHLSDYDIELFAKRKSLLINMPCSNMKLNSGSFKFNDIKKANCNIAIGTDGCTSNNNLSMFDEMKFAALSAKREANSPLVGKVEEIYNAATIAGAKAFNINAGEIVEGKLADLILVDLNNSLLVGCDLMSDMVYSADSSCVNTVICDGNILMKNHYIDGEKEVIAEAKYAINKLIKS